MIYRKLHIKKNTLLIGIHSMQGRTATTKHGVTRKTRTKRLKHKKGQRKELYKKGIPESSCARTETVDIDILVTSRNGDRKIMQSIKITSRPTLRKRKWNHLSQF